MTYYYFISNKEQTHMIKMHVDIVMMILHVKYNQLYFYLFKKYINFTWAKEKNIIMFYAHGACNWLVDYKYIFQFNRHSDLKYIAVNQQSFKRRRVFAYFQTSCFNMISHIKFICECDSFTDDIEMELWTWHGDHDFVGQQSTANNCHDVFSLCNMYIYGIICNT